MLSIWRAVPVVSGFTPGDLYRSLTTGFQNLYGDSASPNKVSGLVADALDLAKTGASAASPSKEITWKKLLLLLAASRLAGEIHISITWRRKAHVFQVNSGWMPINTDTVNSKQEKDDDSDDINLT